MTSLELDPVSPSCNLELARSSPSFKARPGSGQDNKVTLFYTLDACQTPMGKRMLRATIIRPALRCAGPQCSL